MSRRDVGTPAQGGDFIQKKVSIGLAVVAFVLALNLTLYPILSTAYNERHQSVIHTQYLEQLEQVDLSALTDARHLAEAYNRSLASGTVSADPFSREAILAASENYAQMLDLTGSGIMGYVEIPGISAQLPIYHGTDSSTLEHGAGHLLGSSLPIGGGSTHTILTGHSGMASSRMFTDLTDLKIGDVFYLNVLSESLAYQVEQIQTVLPHDTSLLSIEPGRDLCTLVTCTPLGVNTHRLLVRGVRIACEEAAEVLEEQEAVERPAESTWEDEYYSGLAVAIGIVVILVILYLVVEYFRRARE